MVATRTSKLLGVSVDPGADACFIFLESITASEMPPGVASPGQVEARLGILHFPNGSPDQTSAKRLYDNPDCQRAVPAYRFAIPAVSQAGNLDAFSTRQPSPTPWRSSSHPPWRRSGSEKDRSTHGLPRIQGESPRQGQEL
jgi:hypothetical protein